jgi:MFS family permease
LSEIPSSYLADRWGRKKTMIAGVLFSLIHWILLIFAHNFIVFLIAFIFASIQYSFFSGTDDALVYDTNRELGKSEGGLKRLLYSAKSIFKIIAPLIGALNAKDLLEWQFLVIIGVDIVATISAFIFAFLLTEPNHYMDLEEMEAGVMKDAWKLIKSDPLIFRAMISRALAFLSMFVVWRFHQKFFIDVHLPIIWLGISWSIVHAINFFYNQNIEKFIDKNLLQKKINLLNLLVFFSIVVCHWFYFLFNMHFYFCIV